ncbi:hypothetical protein BH20ACT9_BH20ACT9_07510 [soil metagenome]
MDFELRFVEVGGVRLRVRTGGSGPPVLLLHGHPQTHVTWHRVAPLLAERLTVVAADLRGYGDSSSPPTTPDHAPYSKRAMAAEQAHDRGGRVAYRMALDDPRRITRLAVLDIVPTADMWRFAAPHQLRRSDIQPVTERHIVARLPCPWSGPP